nr:ABC transporter substrate-binding protein [uncultured Methanospirillum sp.]
MREKSKVFLHLVLFGLLLFTACISLVSAGNGEGGGSPDEITLHAVVPNNGDLAQLGIASEIAMQQAVDDFNSFYKNVSSPRVIRLVTHEVSSDPASALEAVKKLHEEGVHMVMGFFSSSQLAAVKPYADEHRILILSTGSSSISLSIPDDNIYRFNPDDVSQGDALSTLLKRENISVIIPLVREDLWDNFSKMTILGNSMNTTSPGEMVVYNPDSERINEIVSRLDTTIGSILKQADVKDTAVIAFTFDDIVQIMEEGADEKTYPNLTHIRFIGTDGNTLNPKLLTSPVAANFGLKHGFIGYTPYISDLGTSVEYDNIVKKLGYEPNGYAYASYDMTGIAAQTAFLDGSEDIEALKEAVFTTANHYRGMLAAGSLNAAGDRIRTYYAYWKLGEEPDGSIGWKISGVWEKINPGRVATIVDYTP